ncbi:hypothetical protein NSP53_23680, partial [Salmonella enterica]|nr:hypothetical protein [Salmonella enterica]
AFGSMVNGIFPAPPHGKTILKTFYQNLQKYVSCFNHCVSTTGKPCEETGKTTDNYMNNLNLYIYHAQQPDRTVQTGRNKDHEIS